MGVKHRDRTSSKTRTCALHNTPGVALWILRSAPQRPLHGQDILGLWGMRSVSAKFRLELPGSQDYD